MNKKLSRLWATKTKDDEWWSSFITSPIAIVINYFIVDIKWITPNLITLLSFIVAIISAVLIIYGGMANFIIAAILINFSHVLDCMDGQIARYRKTPSRLGCFFDKLTDQLQIALWFGSIGYASYEQSLCILPIFLAFVGVVFYNLRGYIKYMSLYTEISSDAKYIDNISKSSIEQKEFAGLGFSVLANLKWFILEQRKIIFFNEGVFIFMLSTSLIFNALTLMLYVFAISQIFYGLLRGWQRSYQIAHNQQGTINK